MTNKRLFQVRIEKKTYDEISNKAEKEFISKSEVTRRLLSRALGQSGFQRGDFYSE